ncbi:MAG: hypothetical protein HY822_01745 [Acidobacteria bacterium]|nr:hypothetical protein [Acidobacteriota bacterium]
MAGKACRDNFQIQKDIAFLADWLSQNFGSEVRDKIIGLIDKQLGLGGKIVDAVAKYVQGKAIEAVLGNLNICSSVMNFTLGIWGFCFNEAVLEQEPRFSTPYSPRDNWNEYVSILIKSWQRGDFRYMPLGMVYGK